MTAPYTFGGLLMAIALEAAYQDYLQAFPEELFPMRTRHSWLAAIGGMPRRRRRAARPVPNLAHVDEPTNPGKP